MFRYFADIKRGCNLNVEAVSALVFRLCELSTGGDSLIKVSTDVRRVQNLGRAKFPPKNLMPGQKVPKTLMTGQDFMNFRVPKLEIFSK